MTRRLNVAIPLAQRLKGERKARGWSQARMGGEIGSSQSRVCDWENGHHEPQMATLKRYADAFGMTVPELLEGVV